MLKVLFIDKSVSISTAKTDDENHNLYHFNKGKICVVDLQNLKIDKGGRTSGLKWEYEDCTNDYVIKANEIGTAYNQNQSILVHGNRLLVFDM